MKSLNKKSLLVVGSILTLLFAFLSHKDSELLNKVGNLSPIDSANADAVSTGDASSSGDGSGDGCGGSGCSGGCSSSE